MFSIVPPKPVPNLVTAARLQQSPYQRVTGHNRVRPANSVGENLCQCASSAASNGSTHVVAAQPQIACRSYWGVARSHCAARLGAASVLTAGGEALRDFHRKSLIAGTPAAPMGLNGAAFGGCSGNMTTWAADRVDPDYQVILPTNQVISPDRHFYWSLMAGEPSALTRCRHRRGAISRRAPARRFGGSRREACRDRARRGPPALATRRRR